MNKYAAQKIANEYYELGRQLALGTTTKTANLGNRIVRGTTGLYGAGLGASLAPLAMGTSDDVARAVASLVEKGNMTGNEALGLALTAPAALGAGILGAKGTMRGYDELARLLSRRAPK